MQFVQQQRDATTEELLGEVFSVQSILGCCGKDKFRIWLVVRQLPASKDVNMEAEGSIGSHYQTTCEETAH
jgi:hypothetical protein